MIERLAYPMRLDPATGRLAVIEQDSDDDIVQCVGRIRHTRPGDRWDAPDLGVDDHTFDEQPIDLSDLVEAVDKYEPRAVLLATTNPNALDPLIAEINLQLTTTGEAN